MERNDVIRHKLIDKNTKITKKMGDLVQKKLEDELIASRLKSLTLKDVPKVPHLNIPTICRVFKVCDGDTVDVVICIGSQPIRTKIRISGIDAPETSLRNGTSELHKEAGIKVKKYVSSIFEKIEFPRVIINGIDKYGGRYLGDFILPDGKVLSKLLIEKKYAKSYEGKAKEEWKKKELKFIINNPE